jgi:hypothetical protein
MSCICREDNQGHDLHVVRNLNLSFIRGNFLRVSCYGTQSHEANGSSVPTEGDPLALLTPRQKASSSSTIGLGASNSGTPP